MHFTIDPPFLNLEQFIIINQTKKVMKAKVTSLFFALMFLPMLAFAANIKVTGRVIDNSGEPLIGVSILVKGTSTGTLTNLDGEFSIDVAEGDVLKFSYVGYQPQEVTVTSSSSSINITMIEDAKKLDEVVVTALGIKREQKSLSYNVQQVKGDMLTTNKDANFVNSLAGKVAGVNINASSSGTGGISKVVMRGTKSIMQSSNALYVVDGVPMRSASSEGDAGAFGSKGATEPIADLNPDDVESMSVLTGAAAAPGTDRTQSRRICRVQGAWLPGDARRRDGNYPARFPDYTGDCDIFQFDSREPYRRSGIQRNPSGCRRVDACAGVRFLEGIGLDAGDSRGSRGLRRVVFCRFTRLYDYRRGYGRHRVRLVEAAPQFA